MEDAARGRDWDAPMCSIDAGPEGIHWMPLRALHCLPLAPRVEGVEG